MLVKHGANEIRSMMTGDEPGRVVAAGGNMRYWSSNRSLTESTRARVQSQIMQSLYLYSKCMIEYKKENV